MKVPILCYHAENASGDAYGVNDHVALAQDLALIDEMGFSLIGLSRLAAAIEQQQALLEPVVVLTCDDGTDYDVRDREHPANPGRVVPSFARIIREFRNAASTRHEVCMANFVIASPEARYDIERQFPGEKILSDVWWRSLNEEGIFEIGSHGLDHNAPCLRRGVHHADERGNFDCFAAQTECDLQVAFSQDLIAHKLGHKPRLFAYPWGQSSAYLRDTYMPLHGPCLGLVAAVSTQPDYATLASNIWWLPRFVCGSNWTSPQGLRALLEGALE